MVLESVVSSVLNQVLSAYVENFNPKQLNVGIWGGDIKLKNLKLKKGALDKFRLPVDVLEGSIGSLILTVPWTALGSRPVKAVIEDIYLLAVPASESKFDLEEEERRKQASKMEKLKNSELLVSSTPTAPSSAATNSEEANKNESFIAAMTNKILDNLQLRIRNIHIRYEDKLSVPGHPFSVGFTLAELSAVSTDESWTESFIVGPKSGVHKLTKLNSLAIYFNTDSTSLANLKNPEEFRDIFTKLIARTNESDSGRDGEINLPDHQYVLKPVSGQGKLILRKQPTNKLAKINCELSFSELAFLLDADQYRDALSCLDLFHFYTRHRDFLRFRPSEEALSKSKARALWSFALSATLHAVHEKAFKWSWECFRQRREDRKSYVRLYKAMQQGAIPPNNSELAELEDRLSYQDIRFYRSLARSEMRKERITAKREEANSVAPASTGWLGWVWGASSTSSSQDNDLKNNDGVLSEEEKKQLYEAIEWDERQALSNAIDLPLDAILYNVQTTLKTGSFTLRSAKEAAEHTADEVTHDIISLVFDGFSADAIQRTDNSELSLSLAGFRVYDGTVKQTKHPQIVRVKEAQSGTITNQNTFYTKPDTIQAAKENPFFYFKFENKPLDGRADNAVTLKMRHLEIVYHPGYVEDVYNFFKPPASQLESVGALINVASETLEGIRQDTRAGLEFALQNHKTVDIKVDMNAPIIIVPEDVTRHDCQHIMLDAGHISVSSNLISADGLQTIKAKQNRHYTEEDYAQLESMMYDQFHVGLNDTQLLLGKSFDQCIAALDAQEGHEEVHLMERISMNFDVFNCMVDNAPNLTRFKIQGDLPQLRINFSDRKYKIVMSMIDVALPNFKFDPEPLSPHAFSPHATRFPTDQRPPVNNRRSNFGMPSFFPPDSAQLYEFSDREVPRDSPQRAIGPGQDEDVFFEAPDPSNDGKAFDSRQKNFELQFTVGKLIISISKSNINDEQEQKLINSVLEGFFFTLSLRKLDLSTEITLSSMYIEDCLDKSNHTHPEFEKLITSEVLQDPSAEKNDLVKFKYSQVQRDHPGFMTIYEGISKTVDADLSTINVVITRTTILELYDWIMSTFTNNNSTPEAPPVSKSTTLPSPTLPTALTHSEANFEKLRVKVKLRTISFLLNDDGAKLATISLSSADLSVLLNGPTMRVHTRLGNLTVQDDTAESQRSKFSQLVKIEGDDLADFQYETFSRSDHTYPGHDSMIYLRSGSIKLTLVDHIVHRILVFTSKFARMKAVMDAASQAARQQANNLAQTISKMHYDVLIKTPIIIFPLARNSTDCLIAHLGEISASNSFAGPDDKLITKTVAGLHNIRLTSEFFTEDQPHELQLLGDVNIDLVMASFAEVDYSIDRPQGPDTDIVATMSDVKINLTQPQYSALMCLATSLPRVFDLSELNTNPDVKKDLSPAHSSTKNTRTTSKPLVDLKPELGTVARSDSGNIVRLRTTIELAFSVANVTLELFDAGKIPAETSRSHSLAKFSLNGFRVHWKSQSDGSMAAELSLKALRAIDTRASKATKFREIIPVSSHDDDQLILSYNQTANDSNVILELDSPNVILSLDYIFSISAFFTISTTDEKIKPNGSSQRTEFHSKPTRGPPPQTTQSRLHYRVNIVQPKLTILSDLEKADSDAVQLIIEKIVITQQETMTATISNMGMTLANMSDRKSGVSFLDECTLTFSVDQRPQNDQARLSINARTTPLVLRFSYRDFLVIYSVYSKALGSSQSQESQELPNSPVGERCVTPVMTEPHSTDHSVEECESSSQTGVCTMEEVLLQVAKLQIILIGDLQELPLLDLNTREFTLRASNWSKQLALDTSVAFSINYFNLKNSHWEPLMELWPVSFEISRRGVPEYMALALESQTRLELNVTSAFIDLVMTNIDIWGREGESVLHKKRGEKAPYLIKNLTGYPLKIWAESEEDSSSTEEHIVEDQPLPWRFEDWKMMRENVGSSSRDSLGLVLQGGGWSSVAGVSVVREGDEVYPLRPARNGVTHRLLCHVEIKANIKEVTFRSTFQVKNDNLLPIEMCVVDQFGEMIGAPYKIAPGGASPVPIEAAYHQRIKIRPDTGFGYDWCREAFTWKDLVKQPVRTIICHDTKKENPSWRFIAATIYNKDDNTVRYYPNITLRLRAPMEVENLLPYDIRYRVHPKEQQATYSEFLRKKGVSPVHIVDAIDLLPLAIEFQDEGFVGPQQSQYAIVNTDNPEDIPIENRLPLYDDDGSVLNLGLHYMRYPLSGGAFKIQIYSPYVVINKTGLDFAIRSKPYIGSAKAIAGQNLCGNANRRKEPRCVLFSHINDDKRNKAILRVGDSNWSKPISFDVVGANQQVNIQTSTKTSEYCLGIAVAEGLGNYNLTKVITIYPRFIIKNNAKVPICLREHLSDQLSIVKPGRRALLSLFRNSDNPQLVLSFDAPLDKNWSRPFCIQNVGKLYIRALDNTGQETLVHVEILLQGPYIFIKLNVNPDQWPFLIRNKSSSTIYFGQIVINDPSKKNYGTIKLYKVLPNSEIPYAWDEPGASLQSFIRVLLLPGPDQAQSSSRSPLPVIFRDVHVLEVGQLLPMRTYRKGHKLAFDVAVAGQAQVVTVSNYNSETNVWKVAKPSDSPNQIQRSDTMSSLGDAGFEAADISPIISLTASINLEGIGISLIDGRLRELIYGSFRGIEMTYEESQLYRDYGVVVRWIQLDNQLDGALFPVLFGPCDLPRDFEAPESRPNLQLQARVMKDDKLGVVYIKYATVLLQKMTLEMDESFVIALMAFSKFSGASWQPEPVNQLTNEPESIPEPDSEEEGHNLYFEMLHLQPFVVVISFERQDSGDVTERTFDSRNPMYFLLNAVTMAIGNISGAPVTLNQLQIKNARMTQDQLVTRLIQHYKNEGLSQLYRVLASADFLGNPAGLFSNVSSGVQDLFYEPFNGVVLRGDGLGVGIARGAASLVKKSAFGVTDSVSKITGSVSKGLSAAALDSTWARERQRRQFRNKNKVNGFATGAGAFIDSLASGIQGVAMKPIQGAENEGAAGFFKGLGKGLVGVVAKPAVGTFDFLSNVSGGIRNATTLLDASRGGRARLPRHIAHDGVLKSYNMREAQGYDWLRSVDNGKFHSNKYVAHVELANDKDSVALAEIKDISLQPNGIQLNLMHERRGPFVALGDDRTRVWFAQHINRVVKEYNEKKNRAAAFQ